MNYVCKPYSVQPCLRTRGWIIMGNSRRHSWPSRSIKIITDSPTGGKETNLTGATGEEIVDAIMLEKLLQPQQHKLPNSSSQTWVRCSREPIRMI